MSLINKNNYIINVSNNNSKNINENSKRNSLSNSIRRRSSNILDKKRFSLDIKAKTFFNKENVTENNSKKRILNNKFRTRIYARKFKEEEKNNSNKKNTLEINISSFFNIKFKPSKINIPLNTESTFFGRSNSKTYTQKQLTNFTNNENLKKEEVNEYKKVTFRKQKTIDLRNNLDLEKQTSKTYNKRKLFLKLKELLEEIEREKNDREANKKKPKKLKDISFLFLERSVKPQIPNLKNRIQLNKYLINDFKENESYQEYINRSLKYRKINENYEMAQMLKKETNKILSAGMTQAEDDEEKNKENESNQQNIPSSGNTKNDSSSLISSIKHNKKISFSILTPNIHKKTTFILKNKNSEEKPIPILKDYRRRISEIKTVNSFKNNLFQNKEEKQNKNSTNASFFEDDFLTDRPKKTIIRKKTEAFSSEKAILLRTKSNLAIKHKKHTNFPKKKKFIFDKFTLSNNLYNAQKKYFDNYLMHKRIIRSKNFSEQISNLAKEKDLFKVNDSEGGNLPKLKEGSLIYEMRLKNLLRNSFNPMTNFKEGDEDLDLDNLKKIKNSVKEMEIEMFTSLKDEVNPKYIKNKFNKVTIGKYHSTRGVYFGAK